MATILLSLLSTRPFNISLLRGDSINPAWMQDQPVLHSGLLLLLNMCAPEAAFGHLLLTGMVSFLSLFFVPSC
jgi:hypothetical protein